MSKIGIITYHFANNYGAVLQCYALSSYLKTIGHEVWVLNFISSKQANNNSQYRKINSFKTLIKNLILLPFHGPRTSRFRNYESFRTTNLKLTPILSNNEDLANYVNNNDFDYIISGSDQVFNPDILDFEDSFFFPFDFKGKKIGYAVSLGIATKNDLENYTKCITDFNNISVREKSAAELVPFYKDKISEVVDPVFLLNKYHWEKLTNTTTQKYVLGYYINSQYANQYIRLSKKIASYLGLKLIIIDARITKNIFTNNIIISAGPKEFLNLFANATFVCTDSFHGTAFSIIYEKRFICFEPKFAATDTRKTNLCRNCGLDNNVFYLGHQKFDPIELTNINIDYSKVKRKLEPYINKSKTFLFNSLN